MKKFNQFIFESKQTDTVLELLANAIRGTRYEHKVFLVGGFVRDSILGRDSKDIDLVVDDEGLDGGIRCASFIAKSLGIFKEGSNPVIFPRFGTAKLSLPMVNNYEVEFVAPRKEVYTPGSRKPLVSAGTLSDDAFRRDFTINALFRKLTTGELQDLTGRGLKDLENKLIRTSSDPDFIFKEDPLRILRAIRFTFKYEFDMPLSLIRAIKRNAG